MDIIIGSVWLCMYNKSLVIYFRYLIKYYRHDLSMFEELPLIPMKSKSTPLDESIIQSPDGEEKSELVQSVIEMCPLGPPNGIVLRHFDGLELDDLEGVMEKLGVIVISKCSFMNRVCLFSNSVLSSTRLGAVHCRNEFVLLCDIGLLV